MAPALSSSSFRLSAANPHSKLVGPKHTRSTTTLVFAQQNSGNDKSLPAFRIGMRRGSNATSEAAAEESNGKPSRKPFFVDIDFSKLPDPKSLVPAVGGGNGKPSTALFFAGQRRKDPRTVFVAGATGQAGVRIAQTLLRRGFSVRAGVPDLASAQELARLAAQYKIISPEESKRLNAVESTFEDAAEAIARAMGNATKVVVTIGRGENGPAAEVTTDDALQVVRAAQLAGVGHVAVVYDNAAAGPDPSTYNVLDGITSFFGNLFSRSRPPLTLGEFISKLVEETEIGYTLIKASLADDFDAEGSGCGVVVVGEGATAADGYKVSKSQIAALVADVFKNTLVAENKVVEVSTSPSAPIKPIEELLSAVPEDGRRKAYAEALAKARAEEEALVALEKARDAAEAAKKLGEEVKKLSEEETRATSLADEARQKAEAAGSSLDGLLSKAKGFGGDFSWGKLSSQFATAVAEKSDEVILKTAQIATVRGLAKARTLPPKKAAVVKPPVTAKSKFKKVDPPEQAKNPKQTQVRSVLGGLFKQETIYVDDD